MRMIETNGTDLSVRVTGSGPAVLLLHGWPHTHRVWDAVVPGLRDRYTVITPDLRGIGDSAPATDGYDAANQAADLLGLLDGSGIDRATVIAIDAAVPPAFLFGLTHPERTTRLVLMESLLGALPGAERFLAAGPPWWFGFHRVPGLAESVLAGHEAEYLDFFYRSGTHAGTGIDADVRDAFVTAYSRPDALGRSLGYYRALPQSAGQIEAAVSRSRLTVPTLAIGAQPVNDALFRQLRPVTDDLTGAEIEDCGHLIPLDRPQALLDLLGQL